MANYGFREQSLNLNMGSKNSKIEDPQVAADKAERKNRQNQEVLKALWNAGLIDDETAGCARHNQVNKEHLGDRAIEDDAQTEQSVYARTVKRLVMTNYILILLFFMICALIHIIGTTFNYFVQMQR